MRTDRACGTLLPEREEAFMTEVRARYFLTRSIPEEEVEFILKNYVCGDCMGELFSVLQNEKWWVICEKCDANTRLYISRHWKEQPNENKPELKSE